MPGRTIRVEGFASREAFCGNSPFPECLQDKPFVKNDLLTRRLEHHISFPSDGRIMFPGSKRRVLQSSKLVEGGKEYTVTFHKRGLQWLRPSPGKEANLSVLPMLCRLCHPHLCRWRGECLSLWVAWVCRFRGPQMSSETDASALKSTPIGMQRVPRWI